MELSELAKLAYNEVRRYYVNLISEYFKNIAICTHRQFGKSIPAEDIAGYYYIALYYLECIMPEDIEKHEDYYKVQALVLNILTRTLGYVGSEPDIYVFVKNVSTLPWVHHSYWDVPYDNDMGNFLELIEQHMEELDPEKYNRFKANSIFFHQVINYGRSR